MTRPGGIPRFAQLTYTSSDRSGVPGGWRVQDCSGDLAPAETEALTRRIVPRFTPVDAVPDYPDERQKAGLPRRLVHAAVPELAPATAHWHTAPSGTDAHGRPGNVFVHVLLDRDPTTTDDDDRRPTDIADSPCWLRPFGTDRAELAAVPGPPWPARVDRCAVLDFVFGPAAPSPAALCLLLDALDGQRSIGGVGGGDGGGPVVLGLAEMGTAACWVATVSHLMGARTARELQWSTYERLADQRSWPRDLDLVVVPLADLDAAGSSLDDVTVVRDDEEAPRGRLGEHRRTRTGDALAVSPWSVLVYEVLTERAPAEAVLASMDAVAAEVGTGDARVLPPAWPLALAVAHRPGTARHALAAARSVLESDCPPHLSTSHPQRYAEILALVDDAVPAGARGAREELRACPAGPRHAILRDLWLRRLLATDGVPDPGSVTEPVAEVDLTDVADLADARPVAAEIHDRVRTWTRSLADRLDPARPAQERARAVRAAVRLVDVLTAAGAVSDADDWDRVWGRTLGLLADPAAPPDVLDDVGATVGPTARRGMSRAAARHLRAGSGSARRAGTRLPVAVLSRLSVRLPRGEEIAAGDGPDELQRELAGMQTLLDPDPQSTAWLVMMWDGLGSEATDPDAAREVRRLLDVDRPLRPEHLRLLVRHRVRADHPMLADALRRTLLAGPSGEALTDLARQVLTDPATGRTYSEPTSAPAVAARLRVMVDETVAGVVTTRGRAARTRREMLSAARGALAGVDPGSVEDVVWRTVLVTHVLTTLIGGTHVRHGGARIPGTGTDGGESAAREAEALEEARRIITPSVFRAGFTATAERPETRATLVEALTTSPDLPPATLVQSALELHLPPGDGPVHPAVLLGPLITDAEHDTTALDDAVNRRRAANTLGDDDLEEALRRLRRDRRENRTVVRQWWDGPADPAGSAERSLDATARG